MRRALIAKALVCVLSCIATAQVAILQIKVVQGEGGVHRGGSRVSKPLTVQVTDQTGAPVEGATITFHLPGEDGPGGQFGNGLPTDVVTTDATGRASVGSIRFNNIAGPMEIRITAVKDQARAGMVSLQYIADAGARPTQAVKYGRKKWIIAALAVVGAATGLALASGGNGDNQTPPPTVSIGAPTITIGRP